MNEIQKTWSNNSSEVITDTVNNFVMAGSHNVSASATTKIYGFYQFMKFMRGKGDAIIRHTITPNINFSYRPDNGYTYDYQSDTAGTTLKETLSKLIIALLIPSKDSSLLLSIFS